MTFSDDINFTDSDSSNIITTNEVVSLGNSTKKYLKLKVATATDSELEGLKLWNKSTNGYGQILDSEYSYLITKKTGHFEQLFDGVKNNTNNSYTFFEGTLATNVFFMGDVFNEFKNSQLINLYANPGDGVNSNSGWSYGDFFLSVFNTNKENISLYDLYSGLAITGISYSKDNQDTIIRKSVTLESGKEVQGFLIKSGIAPKISELEFVGNKQDTSISIPNPIVTADISSIKIDWNTTNLNIFEVAVFINNTYNSKVSYSAGTKTLMNLNGNSNYEIKLVPIIKDTFQNGNCEIFKSNTLSPTITFLSGLGINSVDRNMNTFESIGTYISYSSAYIETRYFTWQDNLEDKTLDFNITIPDRASSYGEVNIMFYDYNDVEVAVINSSKNTSYSSVDATLTIMVPANAVKGAIRTYGKTACKIKEIEIKP